MAWPPPMPMRRMPYSVSLPAPMRSINGVMMLSVNFVTRAVNAVPMTTATDRSTMFPRARNSFKPFNTVLPLSPGLVHQPNCALETSKGNTGRARHRGPVSLAAHACRMGERREGHRHVDSAPAGRDGSPVAVLFGAPAVAGGIAAAAPSPSRLPAPRTPRPRRDRRHGDGCDSAPGRSAHCTTPCPRRRPVSSVDRERDRLHQRGRGQGVRGHGRQGHQYHPIIAGPCGFLLR